MVRALTAGWRFSPRSPPGLHRERDRIRGTKAPRCRRIDSDSEGDRFPLIREAHQGSHQLRRDEQGNWAQHREEAGATFLSPMTAECDAYTVWRVSSGSTLNLVLDETGRFLYERPLAGGGE